MTIKKTEPTPKTENLEFRFRRIGEIHSRISEAEFKNKEMKMLLHLIDRKSVV